MEKRIEKLGDSGDGLVESIGAWVNEQFHEDGEE